MPRVCVLCPSGDGIDVSHNQACTAIAKLAEFECDLLHIAELNSSPLACFSGTCDGRDAVPHRKITALDAARRNQMCREPCMLTHDAKQSSADG
jgi:hypothetical protein